MATTVSSESNTFLSCLIDTSFDLDEALTMPLNLGEQITASNFVVAEMPTVTTDDVCTICVEGFQSDIGGKRVPCGHVFHATCISSWLSHSNCCPLCRCNIFGRQ